MEPISILTVVGLSLNLIISIMREFFSAKAKAKELDKKFEMNQKIFLEFADKSLLTLREQIKKDSATARDLEDQIDRKKDF